jgi:hypothetical protein
MFKYRRHNLPLHQSLMLCDLRSQSIHIQFRSQRKFKILVTRLKEVASLRKNTCGIKIIKQERQCVKIFYVYARSQFSSLQYRSQYAGKEAAFHIVTCRVVRVTKITGSSSDD